MPVSRLEFHAPSSALLLHAMESAFRAAGGTELVRLTPCLLEKHAMTVEHAVYLVIKRLNFAENGWPGYVDIITEPAYTDSGAARAQIKELAAFYETHEKRKTLAALGTKVRFYLRDLSLVEEMEQ